jgi:arylformamidase
MPGEVIDISRSLGPDTPVWPGDPPVVVEPVARWERGDVAAVSRLTLSTHAGTHVDPPAHFVPGGTTVDILPLDVLVGPAVVVDLSGGAPIDAARLAAALGDGDDDEGEGIGDERIGCPRLLFRTGAADDDPAAAGALTPDGARWLVEHGVRLVGADTLSIEPASTEPASIEPASIEPASTEPASTEPASTEPGSDAYPVHRILLGAGVIIVEGLDLFGVTPGHYQLACLPLRIAGGDGAPARAVLISQ